MKSVDGVKLFVAGVTVALLAMIAFRGAEQARAGGASVGTVMALTGVQQNNTMLFLVDAENKSLAVYAYDGNQFQFRAARYFAYDLGIFDHQLRSGISIEDAKEHFDLAPAFRQWLQDGANPREKPSPGRRR